MLNQTGFTSKSYSTRKTILVDEFNSTAMSCMVTNAGVTAGKDGKQMILAGTPVYGDILDRATPFTVSGTGNPVGVILHDVDVTSGQANSQFVIFGFIDISKVDETVAEKLKSVVDSLKMIQLVSREDMA